MKRISILISLFVLSSCNQQADQTRKLKAEVDSLRNKLNNVYAPGLGEFMSGIQVHHAKLWFAGINNNWKLADFEIHEIIESLDDIQHYNTDRPEIKSIGMLLPAIDSVNKAINLKNPQLFKSSYILLTNTCNTCHKATAHEFNVITIPTITPFSNQDFKPVQ
jgi:hypothetical protein